MDKNIAIEFDNVSKQYRLGRVGTGTLQHDINRWIQTSILRRPDPYLRVGETNDRAVKGESEYVWALQNVSLQIEQGDVVGFIGKNGSGKSTLLKLLSRITSPTIGKIDYRGRIASLLEIGTGFHPEMTAKENIYMNGSILGMKRSEINARMDEIVDFSGVERYLDTPVKRFSSGMYVRLGFAVAAFLEPEILVVDEVLAVGDAEFQKKAIGKMKDVSTSGGRTVLFVSHNMAAVRKLCHSGYVLNNGLLEYSGTADECVDHYLYSVRTEVISHAVVGPEHRLHIPHCSADVELVEASILNDAAAMASDEPIVLEMIIQKNKKDLEQCQLWLCIMAADESCVATFLSSPFELRRVNGRFRLKLTLDNHTLGPGQYSVCFRFGEKDYSGNNISYDIANNVLTFEIKYAHYGSKEQYKVWYQQWGYHSLTAENGTVELFDKV